MAEGKSKSSTAEIRYTMIEKILRRMPVAIGLMAVMLIVIPISASASDNIVINEIMFDPMDDDAGNESVELYNNGTEAQNISGWTISNRTGEIAATLPGWNFSNGNYLVVYFGNGSNDNDFSDGNGSFYTGVNLTIFNNTEDECALYNGTPSSSNITDFVSWCFDEEYNKGQAHNHSVNASMWNSSDYYAIIKMPQGRILYPEDTEDIQEGDTIGRDRDSTDTNTSGDWMNHGGSDAGGPTLGLQNIYPLILNVTIKSTKMNRLYDITSIPDDFRGSTSDNLGICWFQSVGGEGAGQQITVTVSWESAKMKDWKYSSCFGDPGSGWINDTDGTIFKTWIIGAGDGDSILYITVRDENGKTDVVSISFMVDNTDPGTPTNAQCRPDSYTDVSEFDDDVVIFFTWKNANDGTGSGIETHFAEIENPTPIKNVGMDGKDKDVSPVTGLITYYVRAVDNVGNYGNTDSDTITIILSKPIIFWVDITTTKPDHFYDKTRSPDSSPESTSDNLGIAWFQSVGGEGAGQQITVTVDWADDNVKDWKYSAAFGDPASGWIPATSTLSISKVSHTWTIGSGDGDSTLTIRVRDNDGNEDAIIIQFKVDNTDPGTPTNAQCRPDSYTDVGETDDDRGIFFTWTNTNDGTGSGIKTYYAEIEDTTPDEDAGMDEKDRDVSPVTGLITYYVWAVDNVSNYGNTANDTINITGTVATSGVDLGIIPEQQRKDTKMLILDGAKETGNHAWDIPHAGPDANWHNSPICSWNCWAASISMINSFYHNNVKKLTQDRIRYQEFGKWITQDDWGDNDNDDKDNDDQTTWMNHLRNAGKKIPELDFQWDTDFNGNAQTPGLIYGNEKPLFAWAQGVGKNQVIFLDYTKPGTPNPTFNQIKNAIDNGHPILSANSIHFRVVDGYHENATGQWIHLIDPWDATERHENFSTKWRKDTIDRGSLAWLNISVKPNPRSDEPGVTKHSDKDGIVDFDEDNRFDTSKGDEDSDNDCVEDKPDVREYVFDNDGNYNHRNPDIDKDKKRKEVDPDNDHKNDNGTVDGAEDKDRDGRYEPPAETDNFNSTDDDKAPGQETKDFGDAPDPTYPTYPSLLASNGARHSVFAFEWLGKDVDGELDSNQVNDDNFDDGVTFVDTPKFGSPFRVIVTVTTSGMGAARYRADDKLYLNAWIDWNADGNWSAFEKIIEWNGGPGLNDVCTKGKLVKPTIPWLVGNNSRVLEFDVTVPVTTILEGMIGKPYYSRFRLDYDENVNTTTGPAKFGEVEDHDLVEGEWRAKWPTVLLYVQKGTKYSIEIFLNKTGYVTRVDFERLGCPVTEIPVELAEQSLAKLPPGFAIELPEMVTETMYKNSITQPVDVSEIPKMFTVYP